jgi:hypothetical protein
MLLDDRLKCYWVIAMHGNMQAHFWTFLSYDPKIILVRIILTFRINSSIATCLHVVTKFPYPLHNSKSNRL